MDVNFFNPVYVNVWGQQFDLQQPRRSMQNKTETLRLTSNFSKVFVTFIVAMIINSTV